MANGNSSGIQVTDHDPDIRLIKAITGSNDLSEFSDLKDLTHLIDTEIGGWNMVTTLMDIEIFDCYCKYLWEEAFKLISKQKENLQAVMDSFPRVYKQGKGKKIFGELLPVIMAAPHKHERHEQYDEFRKNREEYLEQQKAFKAMLREDETPLTDLNIDVLIAEGSIFAEEWFKCARLCEKERVLAKVTNEKATDEIQTYQFAISYIYHLMKPMMEKETSKVTPAFLYTMLKVYWLIKLAKDEQLLRSSANYVHDASKLPKTKLLTFDDYAFKMLLPEDQKGATVRSEKNFYRDVAIKAWAYGQTKDKPVPQNNLMLDLTTLEYFISMGEEGIRKHLRKLLKPDHLVKTLPEEIAQEFLKEAATESE